MHALLFSLVMIFCLNPSLLAKDPVMPTEEAIFSMGCFWCGESEFRDEHGKPLDGITSLRVGYAGGTKDNPTYHDHEGYKEAVKIVFDPKIISYQELLHIFWKNIDPLDGKGQFCDKGFPYTSVIFYSNDTQKKTAEETKEQVKKALHKNIETEMIQKTSFFDAEEYHQDYKHKNPLRYKFYRWNCGRDARLKSLGLKNVWRDGEAQEDDQTNRQRDMQEDIHSDDTDHG